MARLYLVAVVGLSLVTAPAQANDWEKFYTALPANIPTVPSSDPPEAIASQGDFGKDLEVMWRRGYAAIGYSSFNSPNSKTKDAARLAKKLKARYYIVGTGLASSTTTSIPLTLPNTTTSMTNGNVSTNRTDGYRTGTYSGTTTTYRTQTTYIPMVMNRFDKFAVYFSETPKFGIGIMTRELTPEEMAQFETGRAFAVRAVRDGSLAYQADLLPGDIITHVNGLPADPDNWRIALKGDTPLSLRLFRNNSERAISIAVPPEWRPQ